MGIKEYTYLQNCKKVLNEEIVEREYVSLMKIFYYLEECDEALQKTKLSWWDFCEKVEKEGNKKFGALFYFAEQAYCGDA